MREQVGCRLADASSASIQQAMSTFVDLIRPGHIDLMAEDCRYMAINRMCAPYAHTLSTRLF